MGTKTIDQLTADLEAIDSTCRELGIDSPVAETLKTVRRINRLARLRAKGPAGDRGRVRDVRRVLGPSTGEE